MSTGAVRQKGYPDFLVDSDKEESMTAITYSNALREQLRDPEAYLDQAGNVLLGLF